MFDPPSADELASVGANSKSNMFAPPSDDELVDVGAKTLSGGQAAMKALKGMAEPLSAAASAGLNEQTLGLTGLVGSDAQNKLQQQYPGASIAGRVLSYGPGLFVGTAEEALAKKGVQLAASDVARSYGKRMLMGPASAIAHGAGELIGAGAKGLRALLPESGALTALGNTAIGVAKTPLTIGTAVGGINSGKDIVQGKAPGMDVVNSAAEAATNPTNLALGYGGQALGNTLRTSQIPEKIYGLSGLTEGQGEGTALENAKTLMDNGVRTPLLQNTLDIFSGNKLTRKSPAVFDVEGNLVKTPQPLGGIESTIANVKNSAGPIRSGILNSIADQGGNPYRTKVEGMNGPLRSLINENSGSPTNPTQADPYIQGLSNFESNVPPEGLTNQQLIDLDTTQKRAFRASVKDPFDKDFSSAKNQIAEAGIKGTAGALKANVGLMQPDSLQDYIKANQDYGAAAGAGNALEDMNKAPAGNVGRGFWPMLHKAFRKNALIPTATNLGSLLNQGANFGADSGSYIAAMNSAIDDRLKQYQGGNQ